MKRKTYFLIVVSLMSLLVGVAIAHAQGPQPGGKRALGAPTGIFARLTYQGRLTNSSGAPINSTVNMVFKLYDASSVLQWTSATRSVTPVNGLFTVYLGDGSDPDLTGGLISVAFIGVTVDGDPEMTPRQPLNTVVGHSNTYIGVVGSSNSGMGVFGTTGNVNGVGVYADGAGPSGTALEINNGGIKVNGAGIGANTPVFIHQVVTGGGGNICAGRNYASVIDHPLTNGRPNAILIISPNYGTISGGIGAFNPYGVFYDDTNVCGFGSGRWVIYFISGSPALPNGALINVLVVNP